MIKWEYLMAETLSTGLDREKNPTVVASVNGNSLAKKGTLGTISYKECPEYIQFIQDRGMEGWEAVSMVCIGDSHVTRILFKRQLQ